MAIDAHAEVNVDATQALRMLANVADAAGSKGLARIRSVAQMQMNMGIRSAFSGARDPAGTRWPRRKGNPDHPPLWKSGDLMRSTIGATSVRSRRLFITAEVQGGGSGGGSIHAQAGATFFGRRDQRAAPRGRVGKGGPSPPRRFAGIGKSGIQAIAEALNSAIKGVT